MRFVSSKPRHVAELLGALLIASFACLSPSLAHAAATEGPNLVVNSSLETASSATMPQGWARGSWGVNTTTYTYPASPAADGSRAARIDITSYTTGDAKWYFNPVSVKPNTLYHFVDSYLATASTYVTVQFRKTDGTISYSDLVQPAASATYANVDVVFVTPANVQSVTVFHLINRLGSLTIDAVELHEVTVDNTTGNVLPNPSFEWANGTLPYGWKQGGWGVNNAVYTYPVAGLDGARAAKVEITSYTTGDAKWYFNEVPVTAGQTYTFSDLSVSNVDSLVAIQFRGPAGLSYMTLGLVGPSSTPQAFTRSFVVPPNVTSLTIYHLIKTVGSLTVDANSLTLAPAGYGLFPQGIVSMDFDDGERLTMQNVMPILNANGLATTQYIISGRFGDPQYVTRADVLLMQLQGHEIGAHTRTHPDLTTLNASQEQNEIAGSRLDLLLAGALPVSDFAYPFGAFDSTTVQTVRNAGFSAARTTMGGTNLTTDDRYQLRSFSVQNGVTIDQVRAAIDNAVATRQWLILVFHQVDRSGAQYAVTPELFQQIIDYIVSRDVPVVTASQGVQMMSPTP